MNSTELITTQENDLWAEAAQRWLEAVERRRGSTRSRQEYEKNIKIFFGYLDGKHPSSVTGVDCQRWVAAMTEAGLSKATINARLAAVSSFYHFACTKYEAKPGRYLHHFNPASSVTRQHINPYEKSQGLGPDQVRALLKSCDRATVKGARDFAILVLFLYTGHRREEIARLTWGDIREGSESELKEYRFVGKGNKTGWRQLPPPAWTALLYYLKTAQRLETMLPTSPLFVATQHAEEGKEEHPIQAITINQLVGYAGKRAGLEHVKPHVLRHSAAKLRRAAGSTLEEVSQFLNHSNIATTQIYLTSLEAKKDMNWQKVEALIGL
jgi:site-specific recombinase XerD